LILEKQNTNHCQLLPTVNEILRSSLIVMLTILMWVSGILVRKRVTITIDESLDSKIREIQVIQIPKLNKSISYSEVLNQLLKQSLISQTSLDGLESKKLLQVIR